MPTSSTDKKVRRLFWDIETSPNIVLSWRVGYKINLGPENILKERAIICIAYKWEGDSTVHVLSWDKFQNDRAMVKAFLAVANTADELVAHNGDRFDMGWFRTRCLLHGFQLMPDYKTVDTLQWARRLFNFNSNRLDYIAKFLGVGAKMKTGFDLWKKIVLDRDPVALDHMMRYCQQDVIVLEKVWAKLRHAAKPKTHAGVLADGEKWQCPHCGSSNVKKHRTRITSAGSIYHQMRCLDCGAFFSITDNAYKAYRKAKGR